MRGLHYHYRDFFPILMTFFMVTLIGNEGKAEEEGKTLQITPLPLLRVEAHPEIQPLKEEKALSEASVDPIKEAESEEEEKTTEIEPLSTHTEERAPLGFITLSQDLPNQKWYLFAAAKRGIRNPRRVIEIIPTEESQEASSKAEAVKNLLVDMGINSEQVRVLSAKAEKEVEEEESIVEKRIYLFSKEAS